MWTGKAKSRRRLTRECGAVLYDLVYVSFQVGAESLHLSAFMAVPVVVFWA
jgi:hypothetical protein